MDDDYEIISHGEVERLKKGLSDAKGSGSYDLKKSIEHLAEKLDSMIDVFEAASEDLREEDTESELVSQKINPILEKLKDIDEQNKKLADGIVAINAIVEEKLQEMFDIANSLRESQMTLQRNLEDAVNKIRDSLREMPRQESRPSFSSSPGMSMSSKSFDVENDLPPLPKAPSFERLMPKKKGLKLF